MLKGRIHELMGSRANEVYTGASCIRELSLVSPTYQLVSDFHRERTARLIANEKRAIS